MGKPGGMLDSMKPKTVIATLQCNLCGCTHLKDAKGLPPDHRWVVKDDTQDPPIISSRCENCDLDDTGHCVIKLEVARG